MSPTARPVTVKVCSAVVLAATMEGERAAPSRTSRAMLPKPPDVLFVLVLAGPRIGRRHDLFLSKRKAPEGALVD
jgi:hypothetical protein